MTGPITTSVVARLLGVSESGVRLLERSGRLPATKTSTGIRIFAKADVERYAAQRAAERAAE